MLKSLKKGREQRSAQKAEEHISKGILLLEGKLYKQSMIEFQNAFELETKVTYQRLSKEFKHHLDITDYEGALSIGLVLVRINKKDFKLANVVGNCARRQKNYKQANNLYRHALKINPKYQVAFYNLAASMGKVEKYDDEVKRALDKIGDIKDYILPEFEEGAEFIENLTQELTQTRARQKAEKAEALKKEIEEKEAENEIHEAKVLQHDLERLSNQPDEPSAKDFQEYYTALIEETNTQSSEENEAETQNRLYNIGLHALQQRDAQTAISCFESLLDKKAKFKYLPMLHSIAMAFSGKVKDAIQNFVDHLGEEQYNRFLNVNLGIMYKQANNRLLATKYLSIGAELLEKSDGLYHLSDLINIADQKLEEGAMKKALKLYKVAITEKDSPDLWSKIGQIYINLKQFDEATAAFREILRIDPESTYANQQLREMHDIFCSRAEGFFHQNKYQGAAKMYEKALKILRIADTIKEAAGVYKVLKNHNKVDALNKEYEKLLKKEKDLEDEKERQDHIRKGKFLLKNKNYKLAIEQLEIAFRMKLDKDVFVMLASIYKSMKRTHEMEELLRKWNKMVEYEDKLKRYEKEAEREQAVES